MEMLFVVLVSFSNGNFQSLEVIEMSGVETELGAAAVKNSSCDVGLAKPLATKRNKSILKMPGRKIHYTCLSASELGSVESIVKKAKGWPGISAK